MAASLQSRTRGALTVGLVLSAFAGCANDQRAVARTTVTRSAEAPATRTASVAAGTGFAIAMLSPVGTETSKIGDTFTARVEVPLRASDGTIVVPAGALLTGRVARLDADDTPVLALDFQTIDTVTERAPVALKLAGAERVTVLGTNESYDPDEPRAFDALFYGPAAVSPGGHVSPPTYLGQFDSYDAERRAIRLPKGATLRVVLTQAVTASVPR